MIEAGVSQDRICKRVTFAGKKTGYLVLPMESEDPIVDHYLKGHTPNDYMLVELKKLTAPGDLVLDVGCHIGSFAIGALALGRSVIAVDANPLHVDLVNMSLRINNYSQGVVINAAVTTEKEPVQFCANGVWGAIDFAGNAPDAIVVGTVTLDEIVERFGGGRRVSFIKMDIEGAEYQAIVSGIKTLREHQPVVWWECNAPTLAMAGSSISAMKQKFEELGYKTFRQKTFRQEGDSLVHAPPGQIQPEAWLDVVSLSDKEQKRLKSRLKWDWPLAEIIPICQLWLNEPYPHTLKHLAEQIEALETSEPQLKEIAATARERLKHLLAPSK